MREHLHERVLHRFIGLCRVPQQVQGQAHRLTLVRADEVGERLPRLRLLAREHRRFDPTGALGTAGRGRRSRAARAARTTSTDRSPRTDVDGVPVREPDEPITVFAPVYAKRILFTTGAAARRRISWYQIPGMPL